MHASKLIQLIKSLSPEEIRWLAKFVRSPYHNRQKEVIALFDYIRKYYPACTSAKLDKELVFATLLPKEDFNDRRLRLIMHRLSNLVEEFLVTQRLKRDRFQYQKYLIAELEERQFYDQAEKQSLALIAELEEQPYRDEPYYEVQWQLKRDLFFHHSKSRYQITAPDLKDAIKQLDTYYLTSKLRYSGELLNRQGMLPEQYEIVLLEEARTLLLQHPDFRNNIVLQLYNDVLLLMEDKLDEQAYQHLEYNFKKHLHLFRSSDQASLLRYLINCTIHLNNSGKIVYLENQFLLYELGIEQGFFLEKGQYPESTFLNIVITGTVLGKSQWVHDFITNNSTTMRENALRLAWAYWHFATGAFEESSDLLLQIEESSLIYRLRVKSLSLRNYFEMFLLDKSYYDLLRSECTTFDKFIRRNEQIIAGRFDAYLQFSSFLRRMGKYFFQNTLKDEKWLKQFQLELKSVSNIVARRWLLEKVS